MNIKTRYKDRLHADLEKVFNYKVDFKGPIEYIRFNGKNVIWTKDEELNYDIFDLVQPGEFLKEVCKIYNKNIDDFIFKSGINPKTDKPAPLTNSLKIDNFLTAKPEDISSFMGLDKVTPGYSKTVVLSIDDKGKQTTTETLTAESGKILSHTVTESYQSKDFRNRKNSEKHFKSLVDKALQKDKEEKRKEFLLRVENLKKIFPTLEEKANRIYILGHEFKLSSSGSERLWSTQFPDYWVYNLLSFGQFLQMVEAKK